MVIALGVAKEVERLLIQDQLSQRAIARLLNISRGTVNSIANGRRVESRSNDPDISCVGGKSKLGRCRSCGGKAFLPCLLCQVRQLEAQRKAEGRQTIKQAYRHVSLENLPNPVECDFIQIANENIRSPRFDLEERNQSASCDQEDGSMSEAAWTEKGHSRELAKASKSQDSSCNRVALPTISGVRSSAGSARL